VDQTLIDQATSLINGIGFPIFVALWHMFGQGKWTRELTKTIDSLHAFLVSKNV